MAIQDYVEYVETVVKANVTLTGTNGTPNMVGRFPRGANNDGDLLSTGGGAHAHGNGSTGVRSAHTHSGIGGTTGTSDSMNVLGGSQKTVAVNHTHTFSSSLVAGDEHSHTIGNTDSVSAMPPYKVLKYIMRMT